jgi:flavin reductase (DIM6/NTAB) family NADH-FMN oxidoreductase RutF
MTERELDLNGKIDQRALRHALGRFATGVAVITTCTADGKLEGLTVNSFASVSLDPPLVLWCLQRTAPSFASFAAAGVFAVSVLGADQRALSHRFATAVPHKFGDVAHLVGYGGAPRLADALAWFECRTERTVDGGDHVIFIGRVMRAGYRDGEPLVFSAGRYCMPAQLADAA